MANKCIKFYYYWLKCSRKENDGTLVEIVPDLETVLSNINCRELKDRNLEYKGDYARLESVKQYIHKEKKYIGILFNRMSDVNTLKNLNWIKVQSIFH